jgi:hypothetical protein
LQDDAIDNVFGEPEAELINKQESRRKLKASRNPQHLLLPAGERPGQLTLSESQGWKQIEDIKRAASRQLKVLAYGQIRKNGLASGDQDDAGVNDALVGRRWDAPTI